MSGDRFPSSDPSVKRKPASLPDADWRPNKGTRVDDVASTITGDALIVLHKNFHIPNDVETTVPQWSDRAGLPPPGYLTVSETSLRVGLHFPPPAELVEISKRCGMSLSQFSYRAMSVTVGLIVLFRDRGVVLSPEHLSLLVFESGPLYCPARAWPPAENPVSIQIVPNLRHLAFGLDGLDLFGGSLDAWQCLDEGFIRGFLKRVYLVQRKAGVEVEGLTPSQTSDDFPPNFDGDEVESELQKAFALEVDDEIVDIE
ncbi:hypothetical protein IEQ34_000734 [Dendrobium chrysotoxum]|uniref:Uncharacterized protein n=1 Tax=Dendrobium chrysotoxum TaxID=161865 RepID=A0AAV7HPW5_DENCH|nr:hypothetical protein IEQ34_000734 [Dendrobium chrysotoxum]